MSLDTTTIQQVRSHGAAIDRRAFEFSDLLLDGFFAACPHLRVRFAGERSRQRRAVATRWAWFVRNLGDLEGVSPELESLGAYLISRGFSHGDFRSARTCLLEATREVSQRCEVAWGPMQESGWAAAIDAGLGMMSPVQARMLAAAA